MLADSVTPGSLAVRRMEAQALFVSALFFAILSLVQALKEPEPAGHMTLLTLCTAMALTWGWYVFPVIGRLGSLEQSTPFTLLVFLAFPVTLAAIGLSIMSPYMAEPLMVYLCSSGVRLLGFRLSTLIPVSGREWVWVSAVEVIYAGFLLMFVYSDRIFGYLFRQVVLRTIGVFL